MFNRKLVGAALAAVAMLVTACSSGSGSGTTSSADTGATSATGSGATGTPIKVALICSCSGPFGTSVNGASKVVDAWAKYTNAHGGVAGHPVKLTTYDDTGNPGTGVTRAQAAISDKSDVIVDFSPLDAAWAKEVDAAKIPVVGGELNASVYTTDSNFFASGQTAKSIGESLIATAKIAGAKKVGILYCAESPSCQELIAPQKAAAGKLGLTVNYTSSISTTAPNYTAQCLAAKQAGMDAISIADTGPIIAKVAADCDRQGYDPIILEAGTGFSMLLAKTAGAKDNLWLAMPDLPFFADKPIVKTMQQAVEKYYPGLQADDNAWSQLGVQGWTAGLLIEAAVKASNGQVSAQAIKTGLESLKDETLGGWTPPLNFPAGKPHNHNCWYTARLQNGKALLANDGKLTCVQ